MSRNRWLGGALGTVLCVATLVPLSAGASLPDTKNHRIVPFEGMGGVSIGMRKGKALKRWGAPDYCGKDDRGITACSWQREGPGLDEAAAISFEEGTVCNVRIRAGYDFQTDEQVISELGKWRTADGVGLGSNAFELFAEGKLIQVKRGVITAFIPGSAERKKRVGGVNVYERDCARHS